MAYTTIAKVRKLIPVITTDDIGDGSITQFIGWSDGEVDSLLSKYAHDIPNDPVHPFVEQLSTYLTAKTAVIAAGLSEQGMIPPETWQLWIDEIVRLEGLIADLPKDTDDIIVSPVSVGYKGLNSSDLSNFQLDDTSATNFGEDS